MPLTKDLRKRIAYRARMPVNGGWGPMQGIKDEYDWQDALSQIKAGNRRTQLITQIGRHATDFYTGLTPDLFAQMARLLYETCLGVKCHATKVTRLRAGEALLSVMDNAVKVAAQLAQAKQTSLLAHLEECLAAFFAAVSPDEFRQVATAMGELTMAQKDWNREERMKAVKKLISKVFSMLRIAAYTDNAKPGTKEVDMGSPARIAAEAELRAMDADTEALPFGQFRVTSA